MTKDDKTAYKRTLEILYSMLPDFSQVGAGAYKPGLDRVEAFEAYLGRPSEKFRSIHVAGTNGKGSVSHMLASALACAGYRTGLYTSPHLSDFRERIRIGGEMIPETEVVAFAERNMNKMMTLQLSFFEATVGMAFEWFARGGAEVAVVETGLGGRLDATNILAPQLSVITNIGLEHTAFLGNTLAAIAGEKAGIIKPGVPVVIGERDPETDPVFEEAARRNDSEIIFAEDLFRAASISNKNGRALYEVTGPEGEYKPYSIDLAGDYQLHNLVTALAAVMALNRLTGIHLGDTAVAKGLTSAACDTGLHGRWEVLGYEPLTVCDTCHNAHGLREVVRQIAEQRFRTLYMVFGITDDKDLSAILPLLPSDAHYIFTRALVDRAMPAEKLATEAALHGLRGDTATDVPSALALARRLAEPDDMIFVGGSVFVVADIPR